MNSETLAAAARKERLEASLVRMWNEIDAEIVRLTRLRDENPDRAGIGDKLTSLHHERAAMERLLEKLGVDL